MIKDYQTPARPRAEYEEEEAELGLRPGLENNLEGLVIADIEDDAHDSVTGIDWAKGLNDAIDLDDWDRADNSKDDGVNNDENGTGPLMRSTLAPQYLRGLLPLQKHWNHPPGTNERPSHIVSLQVTEQVRALLELVPQIGSHDLIGSFYYHSFCRLVVVD
ncbi:MAG: hypothetical protein BYD32DRAFT_436919 [Podila humilis]|nr:MAG: hypothetical protein BYD32DRAFT_436919 [Podila humilis]